MYSSRSARVLVVAHKTAASPALLEAVRARAACGPAAFHLLVPAPAHPAWRPSASQQLSRMDGELVLVLALPLIADATASPVSGSVSPRHDPMDAIEDALRDAHFDEIILSTLSHGASRWLHIDLPRRVAHLGLPLTTVTAPERVAALA